MQTKESIAKIIYNKLDYMYCDNCRNSGRLDCDFCYRKYNDWGISMDKANEIAEMILKDTGEVK